MVSVNHWEVLGDTPHPSLGSARCPPLILATKHHISPCLHPRRDPSNCNCVTAAITFMKFVSKEKEIER